MSHILGQNSMRYSRMLEESSFANRKADYFWLLFSSSRLMLLVRPSPPSYSLTQTIIIPNLGPVATLQSPVSLLPSCLRAHLLLVAPAPLDTHIPFQPAHHHCAVPFLYVRRLFLGAHWHVARGGKRPRRVCCPMGALKLLNHIFSMSLSKFVPLNSD
jgi:hypothetical protein